MCIVLWIAIPDFKIKMHLLFFLKLIFLSGTSEVSGEVKMMLPKASPEESLGTAHFFFVFVSMHFF